MNTVLFHSGVNLRHIEMYLLFLPMMDPPMPLAVLSHSPTVSRYPPTLSIQDASPSAAEPPAGVELSATCLLCLWTKVCTTSSNALLLEKVLRF